jgi:hypothetical protein
MNNAFLWKTLQVLNTLKEFKIFLIGLGKAALFKLLFSIHL